MSANAMQVGGDHYQKLETDDGVQHWDVVFDVFGPGYFIGCATKYIARWNTKNGLEDLQKGEHFLVKLSELWIDGSSHGQDSPRVMSWLQLLDRPERTICGVLLADPVYVADVEHALSILRGLIRDVEFEYENAGTPPDR